MISKQIRKNLIEQAKKRDWDDLAYDIILMESALNKEHNSKYLNLLKSKIEIWEQEKASRLFNDFDMKVFLNKNIEDSDF